MSKSGDLVSIIGDLLPLRLRTFKVGKFRHKNREFALHAVNRSSNHPRRGRRICDGGEISRHQRNGRRIFAAEEQYVLFGTLAHFVQQGLRVEVFSGRRVVGPDLLKTCIEKGFVVVKPTHRGVLAAVDRFRQVVTGIHIEDAQCAVLRTSGRNSVGYVLPVPRRKNVVERVVRGFICRLKTIRVDQHALLPGLSVPHVQLEIVLVGLNHAIKIAVAVLGKIHYRGASVVMFDDALQQFLASRNGIYDDARVIVLRLHPSLELWRIHVLHPAVWIRDLGAEVVVYYIANGRNRRSGLGGENAGDTEDPRKPHQQFQTRARGTEHATFSFQHGQLGASTGCVWLEFYINVRSVEDWVAPAQGLTTRQASHQRLSGRGVPLPQ